MRLAGKLLSILLFLNAAAFAQTIPVPQNENDLPSFSTVSDSDPVRIIKNGVSGKALASEVRKITTSKITDMTVVGQNWITTASPGAVTFPMVNVDNTITYLDATAFLAAIGAGPASLSIREIDGTPTIPLVILEVSNGTLTDMGGGIARLDTGSGGGGGTWGSITGTLSNQTDLQSALNAKLSLTGDGSSLTNLSGAQLAAGSVGPTQIASTAVTAGSYTNSNITIDADGRVIAATNGSLSGTVLWGTITGTLSLQTDLQAALNARQPLNSNLTAISLLTTTTFGRGLLDEADATAARSTLGLVIGTNVLAPTGDGSQLTGFTDAQIPATIARDAEVAAAYQPLEPDLTALGALSGTGIIYYRSATNVWSPVTIGANLTFNSGTLAATGGGGGSGTPPGSDTQVIFNDGGIYGADADFTWNKSSNTLTFPNLNTTNLNAAAFKVLDTPNQSHGYMFSIPTDLTADKSFQITGGFNFNLTLAGDATPTFPGGSYTVAANANATGFNGNLTSADDTLQEVAQKFDDYSGITPPGADTQILFNDGGVAGGDPDLTWNKSTNTLSFPSMTTTNLTAVNFKVLDNADQSHGLTWIVNGNWTSNHQLTYTGEFNLGITLTGDVNATLPSGTFTLATNANAAGFNGNLATTDDTLQEIAQKVDDLVLGGGGGGSAIILDIADNGVNESTGVLEIATTNDTPGFLTEPSADKVLMDLSKVVWTTGTQTIGGDKTYTGTRAYTGVQIVDDTLMGALAIDVAVPLNRKSLTGPPTFTFSNPTPTEGTTTSLFLTDVTGANVTVTIPASVPFNRFNPLPITAFTLTGNARALLTFRYINSTWYVEGIQSDSIFITPTVNGALTFENGFLYANAAMGALVVDTAELNNTKSVATDSTLTFSGAPGTGSIFGLQITNTDSVAHTITMPSSKSEALGGASRTTFTLWAGQTATLKWRHEGSGVYTVWGDPVRLLDLTSASIATTDSIQFYDTTDGLSKRDTIANLSTLISSTFSRTGVRRTVYINAGAMIARTTNGAATGTTELATNDIMFDSFDFDSSTSEGVGFWWTPPTTYNAGTVTAKFNWTAASGTGTATWSISARAFGDDDAMDQTLGTAQATTDTLITANDMHVTSTTSALTIAGTPAANKPTYWQITRDVADTLSADAKLLGVTLEYTESSTEPSAQ